MTIFFTKENNTTQGFTLVELLVVLGLFSSIVTLTLGTLFNAQVINGNLQQTQSVLDNVNLSVQTMSRDIRFGTEFFCDTFIPVTAPTVRKNCVYGATGTTGGSVIAFRPSGFTDDRDRVAYYVQNGTLYKTSYPFGLASSTEQMTSDDVDITNLTFYLDGAQTSDGSNDFGGLSDLRQPIIVAMLSGTTRPANNAKNSAPFSLQFTVSVRNLDNK
jgi:prepilin-type N-terminal cleavage/methylation domain-containing protein